MVDPGQQLEGEGWTLVPTGVTPGLLGELRSSIFAEGTAGTRCLLDSPVVTRVARQLREKLSAAGLLARGAVTIQAIAFDKTPGTNWKVAWHQDLMFPFASPVKTPGYELPATKSGIDYARPPLPVLQELLAVRLHLDPCGPANGPLRVSPGSHRHGLIPSKDCARRAAECGEKPALAETGEAILMRPLLLHASSQATQPDHRRVLHLVYHCGEPVAEAWHRAV